jgi:hypothetical protein
MTSCAAASVLLVDGVAAATVQLGDIVALAGGNTPQDPTPQSGGDSPSLCTVFALACRFTACDPRRIVARLMPSSRAVSSTANGHFQGSCLEVE